MSDSNKLAELATAIKSQGKALGFQQVGICNADPGTAAADLTEWLAQGYHGEMRYMEQHSPLRRDPSKLVAGARRIISVRLDYLPDDPERMQALLERPEQAYISRYALGRDYHKLMRKRLAKLAKWINNITPHRSRAFVDSAPVMEKPLARNAGLGWIGKHTNLINKQAGSWFFLGEIYTDLDLPVDEPASDHCGSCTTCIDICPTQAIIGPYRLDAKRCISYLTIELKGSIPVELRPLIGNRIYGCDDCQLFCPWNRFAALTSEPDFSPRHQLDSADLITLFRWSKEEFLTRTEGSAIRRTGYTGWLRNIAVALGNGPATDEAITALNTRLDHRSDIVREHVAWALQRLTP